ncbi:Ribosomal protein [Trema orientale]|uniref:Ribosomal protein n=1 Tax=Trema orientale TaxID=63057 RepID=A0A2P5EZC0_TREOI|nr:Ribosomal protein [Trema orientale]
MSSKDFRTPISNLGLLSRTVAAGGYVLVNEKLPNYVVPDLTDFKLKPYFSQCPRDIKTAEAGDAAK